MVDAAQLSADLTAASLMRTITYPTPLSLAWRVTHFLWYFAGGLLFLVGSIMYYPEVGNLLLGGWLFTIGSLCLTIADTMDWWRNNRVGCFMYQEYVEDYESRVGYLFAPADTMLGMKQRSSVGMNFFWSAIGSFLYCIGSVFLIPTLDAFLVGDYIYIIASLVIMLAQWAKVFRAGFDFSNKHRYQIGFRFENWLRDVPGLLTDISEGAGAFCYLVGTLLFLPETDIDSTITTVSATWFEAGGVFYVVAALFLGFKYFFTLNYPFELKTPEK